MTTQENPYWIPKENYKKVEEVRYLDGEIQEQKITKLPSLSEMTDENGKIIIPEWLKNELANPEAKFDVSCVAYPNIWDESDSAHTFDNGFEAYAVSTKGRIEFGVDKRLYAGAGGDLSAFRYRDGVGDLKLFTASASAEAGIGGSGASAKYKLGFDIANAKAGGVKSNFGVDVGSEASIGEGSVKLKAAGIGFSIGKEMGISTPLGGISINLEEANEKCIIQ